MCWASNSFSLFGSVRSACAASDASSAVTGFTAWRASSRLRKSSGVLRSEGSPIFFSLISPPSESSNRDASRRLYQVGKQRQELTVARHFHALQAEAEELRQREARQCAGELRNQRANESR